MTTSGVSAASSTNPYSADTNNQSQTTSQSLGEDAFMSLLLAQLQNQDPLNPMEDKDFIAQLAQFQSLNQLTQMSTALEDMIKTQYLSQGSALIGKSVTGLSTSGQLITGIVSGLQLNGDAVLLDLDGDKMPIDGVQTVTNVTTSNGSNDDGAQD